MAISSRVVCSISLRASYEQTSQIDLKMRLGNPVRNFVLWCYHGSKRTDQINISALATQQIKAAHITRIYIVLGGLTPPLFQALLDMGQLFVIGHVTSGTHDIGDQVRITLVICFGQLYFITDPFKTAFTAVACFRIVWRLNLDMAIILL